MDVLPAKNSTPASAMKSAEVVGVQADEVRVVHGHVRLERSTSAPTSGDTARSRRGCLRARAHVQRGRLSPRARDGRSGPGPAPHPTKPTRFTPGFAGVMSSPRPSARRSCPLARPVEQRPHDATPLAAELAARRVALARVEHLERDGLVDGGVMLELREVDAADRGLDDRRALVQQIPGDPRGRDVRAGRGRLQPTLVGVHCVERDRALPRRAP